MMMDSKLPLGDRLWQTDTIFIYSNFLTLAKKKFYRNSNTLVSPENRQHWPQKAVSNFNGKQLFLFLNKLRISPSSGLFTLKLWTKKSLEAE